MNLKERGITVGDLLIILIIIATLVLIKNLNKNKKTMMDFSNHQKISHNKISLNNYYL